MKVIIDQELIYQQINPNVTSTQDVYNIDVCEKKFDDLLH